MGTQENKSTPSKEAADTSLNFSNKTLQDYEVVSVIGNGAFGTCFKVRDKENGQIYAWKGLDYDELSESQKESLISEISVLRQLQHPNIVQYFHHLVNHEAKSIFIVMECCEGGDLARLIAKAKIENKRFEERYIWRVLFQICQALKVCHNKIKEGTILHRDIKPANIFLDMEGNVKLGDFGLARMLRRNETFAETFVGTPYYMSPEIIKGSKYDRKSDVWGVGCLIYEMCSLRPPFKGKEFNQLSANISIGKFSSIPDIYSKDLQEIISFMLEVENDERPSIEVISRHPLLVRNINDLGNVFPNLVDAKVEHEDFYVEPDVHKKFSSTMFSDHNSLNEGYGPRRLSITGVFTPDLKAELFYSAKRKIFPVSSKLQLSDPELYESIRRDEYDTTHDIPKNSVNKKYDRKIGYLKFDKISQPDEITSHVFHSILQQRLHAIRAQESLLRQREENLNTREQQLNEKEKRLIACEESLISKYGLLKEEHGKKLNSHIKSTSTKERLHISLLERKLNASNSPPPIPPRKTNLDDTYCTIEPSDTTLLHQPTVAKINMAALPAAKVFPSLRRVTFQSPKKFITYHIDSKIKKTSVVPDKSSSHMQSSISSKSSEESSQSVATSTSSTASTTKRKSILSIFGLSRNSKESTSSSAAASSSINNAKALPANQSVKEQNDQLSCTKEQLVSKCETTDLASIWTKEHKKAAFEMLAALNAAERSNNGYFSNAPRHKIRHSVRDRHTLQRSRIRRSVMEPTRLASAHQRDQIVV